jgi:predicted RNase H-like HicB family nuclease
MGTMDTEAANYTVVLERQLDGEYLVLVRELPGCASQGDSREEAVANIREAISLYVDDCVAAGDSFVDREDLDFVDIQDPNPPGFPNPLARSPLNHPSPELRQALERMGFVYRGEKGKHIVLRRDHPHLSRVIIMKGLDRREIDEFWNSLSDDQRKQIERDLMQKAPLHIRKQHLAAEPSFERSRQELIDGYVQKAARAAKPSR